MIVGTGLDIVEINRIQLIHDSHGVQFAQRILCESEMQEYQESKYPVRFLAKRFAAKEAVAKALGTGFSAGIGMKMIGIGHDASGRPLIELFELAKERADKLGMKVSWLSISDEKHYATAFVVMEGQG
ncbi:MAG: holo-ACP synthase [Gammaproteobacteria bacterium]|nr:holo-ACP synthase [Gammaproteobacteria bacterium]